MKKVFLGMSGGVDSSVSAVLLKEQGYDVTGIYMKNWSQDLPGMKCPWAEDLADAKRVAVQLDLDFEVWDFESEYKQSVVDYMLTEFKNGRTPNPDVICNELIKFKLFYDRAMARGADFIATGHYARTSNIIDTTTPTFQESPELTSNDERRRADVTPCPEKPGIAASDIPAKNPALLRSVDENKDQTYFLYRMSDAATAKTLFPVGSLTKPEVKQLATAKGLDVATKKESMGVCFVGEVGMKDFLQAYLPSQPGEIREVETDQVLGYHEGAIFYTLGQRHGLYLGGGLPYYVVKKDLAQNLVYVSKNLNHPYLWARELTLENLHLRNHLTVQDLAQKSTSLTTQNSSSSIHDHCHDTKNPASSLTVRLRHRAPLIPVRFEDNRLIFPEPIKRPAAGQSAVLYDGEICLGGGYITE